jgi:predicted PurR-regulated permease PerM
MEPVGRISTQKVIAILVAAGIVLYLIRPILLPFVLAAAIAYALDPAVECLSAQTSSRRWASATLIFTGISIVLTVAGLFTLPSLISQLLELLGDMQSVVEHAIAAVIGHGSIRVLGISTTADQLAANAVDSIRSWLMQDGRFLSLATIGVAWLFGFFLFLALLLYFLISGPAIGHGLLWLVPPGRRALVRHVWTKVDPVLRRYFVGLAAIVCFASAVAYVGLGIVLKLPGALLLSLMTGILELIPMIGPAISVVLVGLIAIQAAKTVGAILAYAVYAALLRISIDQFFGPLVLGRASFLHPVVIIFCFLAGGYLFGVIGMLLATPLVLTTRIVLQELYGESPEDPGAQCYRATPESLRKKPSWRSHHH